MSRLIKTSILFILIFLSHSAFAVRENSDYVNFDRFQLGVEAAVVIRRHAGWGFPGCPSATVAIIPSDASNADAMFSVVMAAYYANTKIKIYGECDATPGWLNIDYLIVEDN